MTTIRLSMFQCMVEVSSMPCIKSTWYQLKSTTIESVVKIHANVPGSLSKRIPEEDIETMKIGSIALKIVYNEVNVSMLIFNNKKIKISGGLGKVVCDDMLETEFFLDFISQTLLLPCVRLFHQVEVIDIKSFVFNANIRTEYAFTFVEYMQFVEKIKHKFKESVSLPQMLTKRGKGRVCATKIKSKDGTIMFDHGCNIQAFSFRSLCQLKKITHMVLEEMRTFCPLKSDKPA